MSYSIIYARQFVKTTRGIIPMALIGDNNVTRINYATGREVRAREWDLYIYRGRVLDMLEAPADTIVDIVRDAWKGRSPDETLGIKYHNQWLTPHTETAFFVNGVKGAKTLEEIRIENPGQSIQCRLISYDQHLNRQTVMEQDCATTEALEAWLDAAKPQYADLIAKKKDVYICMGFWGERALKHTRRPKHEKPVIAKAKGGYVCAFTDTSLSVNRRDSTAACVFPNVDKALEQLPQTFGPYAFVDAANAKKAKPYVLRISKGSRAGYYISKLTAHTLRYEAFADAAKKFHSEAEARKWFEAKIGPTRFAGVEAVEVIRLSEVNQ